VLPQVAVPALSSARRRLRRGGRSRPRRPCRVPTRRPSANRTRTPPGPSGPSCTRAHGRRGAGPHPRPDL